MKGRLFSIASVAILLCLVLGSAGACTGPASTYRLTIASTTGGYVTPTVGTHTYDAGTVVNLTATADADYRFVNWTGGGADVDDANAATTTITMNSDHSITANFVRQYDLTVSSTDGGDVATPTEGTHTYDAGTVVDLVATVIPGYHFVSWTGGGGDIDDADDATTTITMNADHAIAANFGLGTLIASVPDTNQPPTATLPTTIPTNYCAPIAMINVLKYWDVPANANAFNVTAGLPATTAAEYLGWFMDTNNSGSPARGNGADGHSGTWDKDIAPGTLDFVRWDPGHNPPVPPAPPFPLPANKLGYDWAVTQNCFAPGEYAPSLAFYESEIDAGRPLVVSFTYWNPIDKDIAVSDPDTGQTVDVFDWGSPVNYSTDPVEDWDENIGHAVTGVGYILNWDPDGSGPLPTNDYVIVHDNWASTPTNVAIPWLNWKCLFAADPGSYEHLMS
jgi:hypothetical protein